MNEPQRYAPALAFPPYAFLPGRDPHPTRDPAGHSHGHEPAPAVYLEASAWRDNAEYLYGVDLYNHGFLWEAHEAWESLWHAAKHDELQAEFLQGLIQCAAASLKVRMAQPRGLTKLSELALARLERVARAARSSRADGGRYMGLALDDFLARFRTFAASEPRSIDERPPLVLEL